MSALGLIIQREYFSKVKTKAFILSTILVPFAFIIISVLPTYLMSVSESSIDAIHVVDNTGKFEKLFDSTDKFTFISTNETSKDVDMKAVLKLEYIADGRLHATFLSDQQQPPQDLIRHINYILTTAVKNEKIEKYAIKENISPQVVTDLENILDSKNDVVIATKRWDESGTVKDTMGEFGSFVGMFLTIFMFMFIMMYGSVVLQSVVEEKSNRIVEVIISSVKPFDLMLGKIIGVALTGITQLTIWGIIMSIIGLIGSVFLSPASLATTNTPEMQEAIAFVQNNPQIVTDLKSIIYNINWIQVVACFIIYFIGGYFLFASLFAIFGSAANDSQEAQQLMYPVTILMLISFYSGFAVSKNPEGTLAIWCSIIPFTSPITMMVRAPYEVPFWQLALSIVLLYATVFFMIKFAGKIYRIGILMHGKKPTLKEILKWVKYK